MQANAGTEEGVWGAGEGATVLHVASEGRAMEADPREEGPPGEGGNRANEGVPRGTAGPDATEGALGAEDKEFSPVNEEEFLSCSGGGSPPAEFLDAPSSPASEQSSKSSAGSADKSGPLDLEAWAPSNGSGEQEIERVILEHSAERDDGVLTSSTENAFEGATGGAADLEGAAACVSEGTKEGAEEVSLKGAMDSDSEGATEGAAVAWEGATEDTQELATTTSASERDNGERGQVRTSDEQGPVPHSDLRITPQGAGLVTSSAASVATAVTEGVLSASGEGNEGKGELVSPSQGLPESVFKDESLDKHSGSVLDCSDQSEGAVEAQPEHVVGAGKEGAGEGAAEGAREGAEDVSPEDIAQGASEGTTEGAMEGTMDCSDHPEGAVEVQSEHVVGAGKERAGEGAEEGAAEGAKEDENEGPVRREELGITPQGVGLVTLSVATVATVTADATVVPAVSTPANDVAVQEAAASGGGVVREPSSARLAETTTPLSLSSDASSAPSDVSSIPRSTLDMQTRILSGSAAENERLVKDKKRSREEMRLPAGNGGPSEHLGARRNLLGGFLGSFLGTARRRTRGGKSSTVKAEAETVHIGGELAEGEGREEEEGLQVEAESAAVLAGGLGKEETEEDNSSKRFSREGGKEENGDSSEVEALGSASGEREGEGGGRSQIQAGQVLSPPGVSEEEEEEGVVIVEADNTSPGSALLCGADPSFPTLVTREGFGEGFSAPGSSRTVQESDKSDRSDRSDRSDKSDKSDKGDESGEVSPRRRRRKTRRRGTPQGSPRGLGLGVEGGRGGVDPVNRVNANGGGPGQGDSTEVETTAARVQSIGDVVPAGMPAGGDEYPTVLVVPGSFDVSSVAPQVEKALLQCMRFLSASWRQRVESREEGNAEMEEISREGSEEGSGEAVWLSEAFPPAMAAAVLSVYPIAVVFFIPITLAFAIPATLATVMAIIMALVCGLV